MKWGKYHNKFNNVAHWHDYVSIIVNEYPILLIRKYNWHSDCNTNRTWLFGLLGFTYLKAIP